MASSEVVTTFRLVAPRWAPSALSGEGSRLFGGRWNSPGRPVVYLGGSRALCALETLVHLTAPGSRNKPFVLFEVRFPETLVQSLPPILLPKDWRIEPPTPDTMTLGDDWLTGASSAVLKVPSAVIPEESNYLLNPLHPDFAKIENFPPTDFRFDSRLIR